MPGASAVRCRCADFWPAFPKKCPSCAVRISTLNEVTARTPSASVFNYLSPFGRQRRGRPTPACGRVQSTRANSRQCKARTNQPVGRVSMHLYLPVLVMCAVSGAYYVFDIAEPKRSVRLMVSAHGVLGALLYSIAILCAYQSPTYRPGATLPFLLAFLLPLSSIVFSFFRFRGPKALHFAQLLNLSALAYTLFFGAMAVSGDWL